MQSANQWKVKCQDYHHHPKPRRVPASGDPWAPVPQTLALTVLILFTWITIKLNEFGLQHRANLCQENIFKIPRLFFWCACFLWQVTVMPRQDSKSQSLATILEILTLRQYSCSTNTLTLPDFHSFLLKWFLQMKNGKNGLSTQNMAARSTWERQCSVAPM
jgi:hypothetical protein